MAVYFFKPCSMSAGCLFLNVYKEFSEPGVIMAYFYFRKCKEKDKGIAVLLKC